jgi:hypothetical protein
MFLDGGGGGRRCRRRRGWNEQRILPIGARVWGHTSHIYTLIAHASNSPTS